MRCKSTYAILVGALVFAQAASGQQIPPAQQLKAPGAGQSVDQAKPAAANATGAGQASVSAGAAPAGAPNVLTLSQAASSTPAPASGSGSTPRPVPPIEENAELATGKNTHKLDAAGPRGIDLKAATPAPDIILMRVSYLDNEPRALLKIYGVSRYVQVGSPVLKKFVTSISDDGVCLNSLDKKDSPQKEKKGATKSGPTCGQLISFQFQAN